MDTVKTLVRFIAVIFLILFICVFFIFAAWGVRTILSQSELEQQLSEIDKQFISARGQIPIDISSEAILPEQIGDFQREATISEFNYPEWINYPQPRFSATYTLNNNKFRLRVWVTILKKSIRQNSTLNNILPPDTCGDVMLYQNLRSVSKIPYLYTTCPYGLGAPHELNQITWENGNWFIQINGDYDEISQFIVAYPY